MKESKRIIAEREKLSYRLLEGETRHLTERLGAKIHWSHYPAKNQAKGTLVLLHGVASNGSRWEEFSETGLLHHDWDIVRMDLRGHAGSVSDVVGTLDIWSHDIKAIIDELGLEKVVVVGHSLGAQVAMKYATLFPETLDGLVLLDPLVTQALTQKAHRLRRTRPIIIVAEKLGRFMNFLGFHRDLLPQSLREKDKKARVMIAKGGKDFQAFIERYSSPKFDVKLIHLAQYARDILETGRRSPPSSAFTFPTLVIGASSGTYTDAARVRQWVDEMPQGTMEIVNCAHWPLTECPDEVGAVINRWFSKTFE